MNIIDASEAKARSQERKYDESFALKSIMRSIARASRKHKREIKLDDYYLFDFGKTAYALDHIDYLKLLGYEVNTWQTKFLDETINNHVKISW